MRQLSSFGDTSRRHPSPPGGGASSDGRRLTGMTEPADIDRAVLAGEPDSARQLEGGDDDLPPLAPERGEWAAADELLEGQPTELGE